VEEKLPPHFQVLERSGFEKALGLGGKTSLFIHRLKGSSWK